MQRMILWRLAQFPLVLAVIYLLTFLLAWVAPGDPFTHERTMDPLVIESLQDRFHARSAWQFLGWYPWNILVHGDFGPSMQYKEWSVNDIITSALPVSLTLGLVAITVALFVGVFVGTLAAVQRGGILDWSSLSITLVGISLPSFVAAAVLLMLAAATRVLPVGGWGSIRGMILPGVALALAPMAYIVRLTRVSMLDVLGSDYVRTARAKGANERRVMLIHVLKNALIPPLTILGPLVAAVATGSPFVEIIFRVPGMGRYFIESVLSRDYPVIMAVFLFYGIFLQLMNLLVDLLYGVADPRIRFGGSE